MSVIELIQQLHDQDIRLWLDDGQLRFSAPKGGMHEQLRDQLREHKAEIISFLAQSQKSQHLPIEPINHNGLQVLSFSQERIWFLSQLNPDNTAFHLQHLFEIKGPLNKGILEKSINQLAERNSILRTAYLQTVTGTWQKIMPAQAQKLHIISLDAAHFNDEQLNQIVWQESQKTFQLELGEVFRHCLIMLNDEHHILLTTVHHIATDGWSMNLLAGEMTALYQALSSGTNIETDTRIQYQDFAAWQRKQAQENLYHDQLSYWREQLDDCPSLKLPADYPATKATEAQGASLPFTLDKATSEALHKLANDNNATLYMVLLALFSIVLQRYSQQDDFCIGTPVAGRNHPQLENVTGCFLNMLAIRCKLDNLPFDAYLAKIRQQVLGAFEHQDIPFEQVVRELVTNRDLTVAPLFQVMFSLHNADHISAQAVNSLSVRSLSIAKHAALYDLSLNASEWQGQINAELIWRRAVLSTELVESISLSFKKLVSTVISNPSTLINQLNCVSDDDLAQQAVWSNTETMRDEYDFIHQYVEEQAKAFGNNIAVRYDQQQLTYQAFNNKANQLARFLQDNNTQAVVGIFLERSLNLPTALLATLKAGFAYLPLDTTYPKARLTQIISDSGISLVITDNNCDKHLLPEHIQLINLDTDAKAIADLPSGNIESTNQSGNLFNLIYTSGSTGEPKGVMVSHKAMINRLVWMQEQFAINSSDRVLQKTPYSFDVSVWEIFWPLMFGAQLVIAHSQEHRNPNYLTQLIEQEKITTIHFVPSMLGVFLQHADAENCASIKRIFCSGEVLASKLASECLEKIPNAALYNLYGPTEAAIDVSWHAVTDATSTIPIGKPIANTQLYIVDKALQLLPTGAIGEILIGGRNIAEGYLNKPDLTASAFIPSPFNKNERLYRTGDLGRYDRDGNVHFIGRQDQQIKIRGFRVELSEIEQCLLRHPDISEALVVARNQHQHDDRLIAYFISQTHGLDSDGLRSFLQQLLPSYMLPNHFIQLNEWPLTAHGKINRQLLPGIEKSQSQRHLHIAPRDEVEQAIAAIWSELLDVQDIGVFDDFFSLGGHSLLASLAVTRMQEHFGINIPLADIFTDPSINTIAKAIRKALSQKNLLIQGTAADGEEDILL